MNNANFTVVGYLSLIAAGLVIWAKWRFASPQFLVFLLLVTQTLGYVAVLDYYGPAYHSYFVLLVPVLFAFGTVLNFGRASSNLRDRLAQQDELRGFAAVVGMLALLAVYHFALVGIPLFQSDAEIARFQTLGQSGLFGLPSRAVLFGIPAMALVTIIRREVLGRRLVTCSLSLYIITQVFLGFKSGILNVVAVVCAGLLIQKVAKGRYTFKRYVPAIVAALFLGFLYVLQVASRYAGLANSTGTSYLWRRLTFIGSEPTWYANMFGLQLTNGRPVYIHDALYFAQKYFKVGTGVQFGYDSLVSSLVTHTPISETAFLVPVTVGAGSYLALSCNLIVGTLILIGIGALYSRLVQKCRTTTSIFSTIIPCVVILATPDFLLKGIGMYLLINNFLIAFVIIVVFRLSILWRSTTLRSPVSAGSVHK